MQTVTAAYTSALLASGVEWQYGLDLLAVDEATPLETSTYNMNASDRLIDASASVILDITAKTHRSFQLTLRNGDGRYLPGAKGSVSGGAGSQVATGLVWYNVRYRPWMRLRTGFDGSGNKQWTKTYLGIYVLTQPSTQVKATGATVGLTLLDKSSLRCKPVLISNTTLPTFIQNGHTVGGYASGSTFDSVMHDLATKGGIPANKHVFTPSSLTLPANYTINEGTEFWTHLQALAGSMAHVLYFDGTGNLIRRPTPLLTNAPPVWTFAPGPQSIISDVKRISDLRNTYNHIIVIGGSAQTGTFRGEAQVVDPGNPYYKGNIGDRIVYVGKGGKLNDMTPDPSIGSVPQAQSRAQMILATHVGQQESITVANRNIPVLEPYDRVTVAVPQAGLNMDFMVQKMTWNLAHSGMSIDATRWYAGN